MKLVESNNIYKSYVLQSGNVKHEVMYYKGRGFVSYWLSVDGIGNQKSVFTKSDIIKEASKIAYATDDEKITIMSTLLNIASDFIEGVTDNI